MTPSRALTLTASAVLAVFTTDHGQQPTTKDIAILSNLLVEDYALNEDKPFGLYRP
jgi:hypothetical protein